jgi:hypothetical protein
MGRAELISIAHDVRNALFGVAMNIDLACEDTGLAADPIRERAIANAHRELARIRSLMDALSELAATGDERP